MDDQITVRLPAPLGRTLRRTSRRLGRRPSHVVRMALERIARKTKRPQACLAWYGALADQGDWTAALKACDAAARMVRQSHWRGELLDGAALAAQELGQSDLSKRLEAAWRAASTMTRLLRWLAVDGDEHERIRSKAARSLARCPKTATRQIGLHRPDRPGSQRRHRRDAHRSGEAN